MPLLWGARALRDPTSSMLYGFQSFFGMSLALKISNCLRALARAFEI